jgi:hypothetical protein
MSKYHVTIEFDVESDNDEIGIDNDIQSAIDDMAVELVSIGRLDTLSNVTIEVE